jgi:hypothetical protein
MRRLFMASVAAATVATTSCWSVIACAQGPLQGYITGFEESGPTEVTYPTGYTTGSLQFQDQWSSGGNYPRVQTATEIAQELTDAGLNPANPVRSGNQALLLAKADTNVESGGYLAYNQFTTIESSRVIADWWARPLTSGVGADPAGLPPGNGKTIGERQGNTFVFVADSAGKRAAAVRFGIVVEPGNNNPYTNAQVRTIDFATSVADPFPWEPSGVTWTADTWYNFKLDLNYETKNYDFYIDGTKINESPIPFYEAAATAATRFYVSRGTNQAGQIIDDVSVTAYVAPPLTPGDFDENGVVDGADFLVWQRDTNVGSLDDWKANFGAGGGAISAIPEPAAATLAAGMLLALAAGRRAAGRRRIG